MNLPSKILCVTEFAAVHYGITYCTMDIHNAAFGTSFTLRAGFQFPKMLSTA